MKERPIIFSGPMVRAILDGRKTQTRRVVKPQPESGLSYRGVTITSTIKSEEGSHLFTDAEPVAWKSQRIRCPYGQPGDRLWVRETWAPLFEEETGFCGVQYAAGGMAEEDKRAGKYLDGTDRWRSPVCMPRWASRITLEVVSVRAERLNEITHHDAIREGCQPHPDAPHQSMGRDFERLWESINGLGSWAENPFVWVVEFKRVEGGGE